MSGGWGRLSGVESFAFLEITRFADFGMRLILVLVDRDGLVLVLVDRFLFS